jgi:TP901 family phage tail tape measure protein
MNKLISLGIMLKAKDMLSPAFSSANTTLAKFDTKIKSIGTSMTKIGAGSTAMGAAVLAPMKSFYNDFTDIAKKEGELESLGIGAKGIETITKEAKKFTNQFARISAPEFLNAAYDIKSGISSLSDEGVAKMTAMSSMTAQATKATGEDMSKLFALGYGIFGKDFTGDFDFAEKFSAAISTSVQAFRTDGADLALGLSNIGAAAKGMGISLEEELAIVGVGKSVFNSASEAGTGYRAFLTGVGKAQEKLGLKFVDSKGKMLPMVEILNKIKVKYKDLESVTTKDLLKEAFGSDEATKLISGLIDKTDELTSAQANLSKNMKEGTAVTEEMAKKMNKGYGIELMTNNLVNLTSTIGSMLEPMVSKITTTIGNAALKASNWIEQNKELATTIINITGVLGAGLVAFGSFSLTMGLAMKFLPLITTGFKAFNIVLGITKIALTAVMLAGKALLLNPVFGSIAAVIGFAAYVIWDNWGTLKPKFMTLFNWFADKFTWFSNMISSTMTEVKSFFSMDSIKNFFGFGDTKIKPVLKSEINQGIEPTQAIGLKNVDKVKTNQSQNVNIQKIEINNPTSTVEVEKGVAAGLSKVTRLSDEEL